MRVLVVAHILAALVFVLAASQVGRLIAAVAGREARIAVVIVVAVVLAVTDVVAIGRGGMALGFRRQTPKSVADDPDRPWWVTPLIWGGDTGIIGSTFRVSSTSWVVLLAALAGLAPWWAGAVYGAAFVIPLAVVVATGEGAPLCQVKPRKGRITTQAVQSLGVALLVAPLLVAAACGSSPGAAPACADEVTPSTDLPSGFAERVEEHGITAVVGAGDVGFAAPVTGRWSDLLEEGGDGAGAKVALWVDHEGPVPEVDVRREGSDERGSATTTPTADGLPGPVPTRVSFPGRGCWEVSVTGSDGPVAIRFAVR
jgi:hypothetical protein